MHVVVCVCVCEVCVCPYREIGFTFSVSEGRRHAACYWRRITEQYWSRVINWRIQSLVFPSLPLSFTPRVNISLTAIISTPVTTATARRTRADNSPQLASCGSDGQWPDYWKSIRGSYCFPDLPSFISTIYWGALVKRWPLRGLHRCQYMQQQQSMYNGYYDCG